MSEITSFPLSSRHPDEIVAVVPGGPVLVGDLFVRAAALAERLPSRPYVINLNRDRYQFMLGFCAAMIAGQCTLMPSNRQMRTLREVAASYEGTYILGGGAVEGIDYVSVGEPAAPRRFEDAPRIPDDRLSAIVFTSGSTGESQPNRKLWKTLRAGAISNARMLIEPGSPMLNLLATVPAQHMWGFEASILLPLFADIAVSALTPLFPLDVYEALKALPRPRALVSSPVHLSAFLEADVGDVDIDYVFTATAPMPVAAARRLETRHGARVMDIFGSSELGMFAARRLTRDEDWQLADAFDMQVLDSRTYIFADHVSESVRLNDRVQILDQRRFRWVGRDDDMINIAGKRGSLADLNQRLTAIDGVEDGVVFMPPGKSKRLAALVVARALQPSDILDRLRDGIEPAFLPRPVYLVPALPRHETGKLPREAVLELFGELQRQRRTAKDEKSEERRDD